MAKKKKESLSRTLAEVSKGVTKTVANDKSVSAKVRKQAKSDYRKASRISNSSASKNYISNSRLRRAGNSSNTSATSASMANRMRGESASQRNAGGNTIREIARRNTPKKNSVSRTYSELQNKTKDMNLTDTAVGRGMARAGLTAKGTAKEVYGGVKTTFSAIRDPNEERNIKADRLREQRGEQTKGNKYEGAYDKLRNAQRDNREQRAKDLKSASKMLESASADKERAKKGLGKAGKFALDVESALLGMAGDAAVGAVTGTGQVGALTSMGVRSFGGGYDLAKREGASDSQAALYGATVGGMEALSEKMFNVGKAFKGVFGSGLGDEVITAAANKGAEKLAKKFAGTGAKNVILHGSNYLASALTEGLEEVAVDVADPFVANAIYARAVGNPHSFDAGQTFSDFMVGAALGGLGGGISEASRYSQGKNIKNVLGKDGLKDVADRVAMADEDSGVSDSARAISQMILNGEDVANAQALQLYKAAEEQEKKNFTNFRDSIKGAQSIIERDKLVSPSGLQIDETGQFSPTIGDNTNIKFQEAKIEAQKQMGTLQLKDNVSASLSNAVASIQTGIGVVDDVEAIVRYPQARAVYESVTGETLPQGRKALREYLFAKNAENRVQSAREETEYWKDQATGLLSQTETEDLGGNGQAVFSKAVEQLGIEDLGGSGLTSVRVAVNDYYNSAKLGISMDTVNSIGKAEYESVPDDIKREAYNAGILDSNNINVQLDGVAVNKGEAIKDATKKANKNANPGKLYVEADNAARKYFTNSQQKMWKALAEEFGIGIHIMDAESFSNAMKSKGQEAPENAEELPNGFYDKGEIYLNVETPDRAMRYVFSHEFTHYLQQIAPIEYNNLRNMMIDAFINDGSLERRIARKRAQYGQDMSQDDILDEILADSTYEFINDEQFIKSITKGSENLAQAVLDAIRNIIRKLRSVIARDEYTPVQNANMYAQLDILKDMESLWLDAINVARENAAASNMVRGGENAVTYQSLISKDDINVIEIENYATLDRKEIIKKAKENIDKVGSRDELGRQTVYVEDVNTNVIVGKDAIKHGLRRNYDSNAKIAPYIGEYLQNSIKVNEINPRRNEAVGGYILLGYGRDSKGNHYPTYFIVETLKTGQNEVTEFDSLHSFNGKKIVEAVSRANPGFQSRTSTKVSVKDLLEIVNSEYSDVLPKSVSEHYGIKRKESSIGNSVKYSLRDTPGKTAKLTEDRIKRLYGEYGASSPKYAQAYITSIHPRDYLKLTISDEILKEWDKTGRELDTDELRNETQTPFLKFDEETGRVEGHEGRHRMKALLDAGVTEVPIALIDMRTKYSKEQKDSQELFSQIFWDEEPINNNARVEVKNLIPINKAYDDAITKAYGEGGDIQFSLKDSNGNALSEAQQEYFKDSKVRDENGNLMVMYHGTMSSGFTIFDKLRANPEGNSGAGFYFSNQKSDSLENYSDHNGADNEIKIEILADQILDMGEWNGKEVDDYDEAKAIAISELEKNPGMYEVYLNITKPYYRDYGNSTNLYNDIMSKVDDALIDMEDYDSEEEYLDDLYISRSDQVYEIIDRAFYGAVQEIESRFGEIDLSGSYSDIIGGINTELFDYERLNWDDIVNILNDYHPSVINEELNLSVSCSHEIARQFIEELGYDGIIDSEVSSKFNGMNTSKDTVHAIAFNPEQAKLTINKKPTTNTDIRFSLKGKDKEQIEELGVTQTESGTVVRYSLKSWTNTDRKKLNNALKKAGFEKREIEKWINDIDNVAAIIAADRTRLDYKAAENQTMLKHNDDYYRSLDASTLCAKRILYQGTYNAIQKALPNTPLLVDDVVRIRQMLDENGLESPCGICYVESRRKTLGKYSSEWLESYKGEYIPTLADVTTTDGLEALRREHPKTYDDYMKAMRKKGVANPKVVELRTDYRGEIGKLQKSTIEKIIRIGGLRIQSFSDFETPHLIDMMQAVIDMAEKKLTAQAYTKVPNFAWAFGDTGIKINLSLIAKKDKDGNLVYDEDGRLMFDSKEGMPIEEALKLRERYPKNVGTIVVGISDEHIKAAMADDRIDMIIPFHRSGWGKAEFEGLGLTGYEDYQSEQEEYLINPYPTGKFDKKGKPIMQRKPVDGGFYSNDYWGFEKSGKENAESYLKKCAESGRYPVFKSFLKDNGDGSFSLQEDGSTDGYWKMLIDFKMYDNDGNGAKQEEVKPNFNMTECRRILNEYEGGADTLPVADEVVSQFIDEYKKNHPDAVKFSRKDSEGNELSEGQANFFADSKARDEDGNLLVGYHGTSQGGFNTFDISRENPGFFTTSKRDADSYGGNDGIGKMYNPSETESDRAYITKTATIKDILDNPNAFNINDIKAAYDSYDLYNPFIEMRREYEWEYDDFIDSMREFVNSATEEEKQMYLNTEFSTSSTVGKETTRYNNRMTYSAYFNIKNPMIADLKQRNAEDGRFYELLERAKADETYDGFVCRNVKLGRYHDNGTVICPFYPEQVKDTGNKNPTEDADIRFSQKEVPTISEDEVYDYMASHPEIYEQMWTATEADRNFTEHKQNTMKELKTMVEKLQLNQKKTNGKVLDESSVRSAMNELVKTILQASEHGRGVRRTDNAMVNDCVANAKKIFTAYKNDDAELMTITALNAAESMVDRLRFIDDSLYVYYKDLRDYLKTVPIKVDDTIKGDIPDYSMWRKSQFGKLRISDNGVPVDEVYAELCEMFPEMFSTDIANPTDQILRMAESVEEIQPYAVFLSSEEYDNLVRQTAGDLIDITVKGRTYKSMADRYEERIKAVKQRADEAKRDAQEKKKSAVLKEREKGEKKLDAEKQKRMDSEARLRADRDIKVQAERDKRKEADKRRKEAYKRRKSMKKLTEDYKWLSDRILKPTDDKHVPDRMVQPLAELLQYIDLETEYSKKFEEKTGQPTGVAVNLRNLRTALEDVAKSEESRLILEDEELIQMIDELQKRIEGAPIYELDNSELDAVQALLHAIRVDVSNANKAFTLSRAIDDTARSVIWEANEYKANSKNRREGGFINQILNESMVKPMEFFEHLGPSMKSTYMSMRKGMDVQSNHMKEARAFFAEVFKGYGKKGKPGSKVQEWRGRKKLKEFELESGEKITLNPSQVMSLYCSAKREQALGHILGQGICASDPTEFRSVKSVVGTKEGHKQSTTTVTLKDVNTIIESLSDEQIAMADKLQNFLNTVVAEWGNETSLLMYDRRKFTEENYFPIKTQDVYLDANFDKRSRDIESIKNFGFTKGTVINANNPIVIDDIFTVTAKHINQMMLYNAYAPAISDFTRIYNYRDVTDNQVESVQAILADTYGGKIIDQYISKFMSDLQNNTQTRRGGFERLANTLLANYKKAAIGASPRVALQQPTAIFRALIEINPKYFFKMSHESMLLQKVTKQDTTLKEMVEHCPTAFWKSMGFNQVDMARDIEDIMMNNEWSRLDVLTMKMYGDLDMYTWTKIWKAIKAEQKDLHPEVEYESDEFWELCNDRAIEVFDKTQVVDSVFHRSDVMRSKELLTKSITSFMSEPTTTFNMFRSNIMKANDLKAQGKKAEARKLYARTLSVYGANAIACAMAAALADAMLKKQTGDDDDDDENKRFFEFWLANTLKNSAGNLNPLNMIPIAKNFSSYSEGWGATNMFEEGIASVVKDAKAIKDKANDPASTKKTWEELITQFAKDSSYITGIPIKNFMRYGTALCELVGINAFAAEKDSEGGQSKSLFGEILEMAGFSNGDDSANSQSQSLESQYEESWLTKKLHEVGITEGTRLDNVLNFFGLNKSIEEQKEEHYQDMLEAAKAAGKGYVGVERDEKIYSKATDGYTKLAELGEFDELARIRRVLVELDVDTTNFDERVESHIKTGIKKQIGEKGDSKLRNRLLNQLKEVYGYTDEQISTDVLAKTDTATAFQKALCEDNYDEAVKQLRYLRQAGLTYEAFLDLYEKRWKVIDAKTTGTFNWPAHGRISSGFGQRWGTLHAGIDIAMPTGTEVVASDGGEVVYTGYNSAMGNYVDIKHSNGYVTRYQHLSSYGVLKGEKVKKGQYIASSGNTGNSTGPHLHFAVYRSTSHSGCSHSTAVDPSVFLSSN